MNENQNQPPNQQHMNPYQAVYPFYYPQTSPAYYPTYNTRQTPQQTQQAIPGTLPMEQSYIENILRLNRGKHVTVYMSFDDNPKTFTGTVEAAGRDHIIIKEPETDKRYLLLMVYLDYITFDEKINYEYPFGSSDGTFSNYPTR